MPVLSTETWWLTQDGKARVPDGDSRAAVLLIHKGCAISEHVSVMLASIPPAEPESYAQMKAVLNTPEHKAVMMDTDAKRKKA